MSARQFVQEDLVASVALALEESGMDAECLELELTESMAMNGAEHFMVKLRELKAMRVRLSIDDFGTGYSSLSYLKRFPLDRLKFVRSFIRDIATKLDFKVTAEGVEMPEQLAFLKVNNCDEFQGFYFSKPLPANAFSRLLRKRVYDAGYSG